MKRQPTLHLLIKQSLASSEAILGDEQISEWIFGKKRGKRVRAIVACLYKFIMDDDDWWTASSLAERALEYTPTGMSSSPVSPTRVAMMLKQLEVMGRVEAKEGKVKKYRRVKT